MPFSWCVVVVTLTIYSVGPHPVSSLHIYTLPVCRGHSWRVRLVKQEMLTLPGHLVSPLVCRGPWMSTVVLYCWCHSDSASVLLYFTFQYVQTVHHSKQILFLKLHEIRRDLTQSYDRRPDTIRKWRSIDNTNTPPETSITQRLLTDFERSVEVTIDIQLAWLNRLTLSQPSHWPQKLCNQKDTHLKILFACIITRRILYRSFTNLKNLDLVNKWNDDHRCLEPCRDLSERIKIHNKLLASRFIVIPNTIWVNVGCIMLFTFGRFWTNTFWNNFAKLLRFVLKCNHFGNTLFGPISYNMN